MKRYSFLLFISLFVSCSCFAEQMGVEVLKEERVHEAYLVVEPDTIILEAVPQEPPRLITETIPAQEDPQSKWISGYWRWSKQKGDYIWVSGVWRRPPPGHQWIKGFWIKYEEGWTWLPGFWSQIPEARLIYIGDPPPSPIEEMASTPKEAGQFWMPGFWHWEKSSYQWTSGNWAAFDPNWVYVPSHYVWRDFGEKSGYIFVPAYWDWPLEGRGTAYACVKLAENTHVFEPTVTLDPSAICTIYYPWWPDYGCFFHFHYFFHPDFWADFKGGIPSWWAWPQWWSFTWLNSWSLWWWWSHPGFPQPVWLNAELAGKINPPSDVLLKKMQGINPPAFVTPKGVVGPYELLDTVEEITDSSKPVFPTDKDEAKEVYEEATDDLSTAKPLRPSGKLGAMLTPPEKPVGNPLVDDQVTPPKKPTLPSKPKRPQVRTMKPNPQSLPEIKNPLPTDTKPSKSPQVTSPPTSPKGIESSTSMPPSPEPEFPQTYSTPVPQGGTKRYPPQSYPPQGTKVLPPSQYPSGQYPQGGQPTYSPPSSYPSTTKTPNPPQYPQSPPSAASQPRTSPSTLPPSTTTSPTMPNYPQTYPSNQIPSSGPRSNYPTQPSAPRPYPYSGTSTYPNQTPSNGSAGGSY